MLHHHPIHRFYNIPDGIKDTISASCSIAPDSRRSDKGLLLDPRVSTARDGKALLPEHLIPLQEPLNS
jgi:hypothetical protein